MITSTELLILKEAGIDDGWGDLIEDNSVEIEFPEYPIFSWSNGTSSLRYNLYIKGSKTPLRKYISNPSKTLLERIKKEMKMKK